MHTTPSDLDRSTHSNASDGRRSAPRRLGCLVVLLVIVAGCVQERVLDRRVSPDGAFIATLRAWDGRSDHRRVVVEEAHGNKHTTVFEVARARVAVRWRDGRNLLVYYYDEDTDIKYVHSMWSPGMVDRRFVIVETHLRPIADEAPDGIALQ